MQAVAAAAVVFAALLALRLAGALERMELAAYDLGLRARPAAPIDERFVIIDETEDDLKRFGHPISDALLAKIVEQVLALEPRVLGVDKFRDMPVPPGADALERAVNSNRNVYWIYQFGGHGSRRISTPQWLKRSAQAGFVDILIDPGGTVRRGLLYLDEGERPQASFALKLALAYLASDGIAPKPDPANAAFLRLGAATIAPLEPHDGGYVHADASGYQMLLDYRGAPAPFARITVGDLLDGKADPALVRDRVAIVGSSAESLKDFFHTPFDRRGANFTTGAEVHAHQASQLLRLAKGDSKPVRTLPEAVEIVLIALCCALGLAAWTARGGMLGAVVAAGAGALAIGWLATAAAGVWLPVVPASLAFVLTASSSAGLRALYEARERSAMMALFSRHVSPEVAQELWRRRDEIADGYSLRPQRLEATVLFADLHGYTPVASRLPPEETARWLNEFMGPMAEVIMAHRGVIRQYAGDAIMAVFGAPIPSEAHERDARTAVECARQMRRRFAELNDAWRRAGRPTAGLRIGIYSGLMVGCNIGSKQRLEYAVVGDAVNVAARLQGLALAEADEGEQGRILVGDSTRALLPPGEPCEELGAFRGGEHEASIVLWCHRRAGVAQPRASRGLRAARRRARVPAAFARRTERPHRRRHARPAARPAGDRGLARSHRPDHQRPAGALLLHAHPGRDPPRAAAGERARRGRARRSHPRGAAGGGNPSRRAEDPGRDADAGRRVPLDDERARRGARGERDHPARRAFRDALAEALRQLGRKALRPARARGPVVRRARRGLAPDRCRAEERDPGAAPRGAARAGRPHRRRPLRAPALRVTSASLIETARRARRRWQS